MKAVVCHNKELCVAEVPAQVPGAGQVLLQTVRCGICGSDLHARTHSDELADVAAQVGYPTAMRADQEVVFGHEICGRILDYGPRTRKAWQTGALAVALPLRKDGGTVHMVGFDTASPGAYAEQVIVQQALTFPVPNGLSAEKAAFTEPLAVALHAVRRGAVRKSRVAVVIGCGPIGLAVILMLKASGVRTVVASDLSPGRRALASRCGADVVVDPVPDSPWTAYKQRGPVGSMTEYLDFGLETMRKLRRVPGWPRLMRLADRTGATPAGPVIFECVGVPGIIDQILAGAPLYSRVVVVGVCMQPDTFRPAVAVNKETELRFMIGYDPAEFQGSLRMIAEGKVDPSPLLTATVGLDGVASAFAALGDPEKHAKILIDPASTVTAP